MIKKMLSFFICCLTTLNISACTSKSNINLEQITITYSWWGGEDRHEKTVSALEEFQKLYPNIKVKTEFGEWTGFKKKMNMKIAGNDEPDLMQINYDWLESYSKDGSGFYDLNKVSSQLYLDNFTNEVLNYGTKNGVLNALPISMNNKVLFCNKTLMNKYGISDFKTWNSLLSNASKISDPNTYLIALDKTNSWLLPMAYIQEKNEKDFITNDIKLGFSQDDIKELLTFYKQLLDNKILCPLNSIKDYNFSENNYVALITWSSNAPKIEENLSKNNNEATVAEIPSLSGSNSLNYLKPSMLYAISKNTNHPEEAALLMNFLLNNAEAAKIQCLDRGIPSSNSALTALKEDNQLKGLQYESSQTNSDVKNILINPYFENTLIQNICFEALTEVSFSRSSLDDIASKTYAELTQTLDTLK
ncbi:ABC transporter substrate-binding protein [Clostridium butyricum]|uniref:ABC transporter substrate-binding protein n=1 Tax=Clostridium butyricum TaxID=1492 RepID=UPI00168C0CF4|nr:ABC transporter substrate-binding protein [Clostridium butyricum]MBS5984388.1 carbohydrate ABC transporter substrate-binding protein [Clostridium butyricum]MDB2153284.1 ABC transporter substrate-binding protein [Clostridium butyricum]